MMYENTRRKKEGNAARKTGNNEYWPQNLELFAKKEIGFRRKRRFVGVLSTCGINLYKFEFIHMALNACFLIKR